MALSPLGHIMVPKLWEVGVASVEERMQASEVMHRGVVTCSADVPALAVARIMAAHRIHSVVVATPGEWPRVVTDADIASAFYEALIETRRADDLAKAAPLLRPSDSLSFALERMHEHSSTHAVVVGRSPRPLGVVSVLDVIEAMLRGGIA